MSITNLDIYKVRIKKGEEDIVHPYLDLKGKITAGIGSQINARNTFLGTDFWIEEDDRQVRKASRADKEKAFRQLEAARVANNEDHNRKAKTYNRTTKLFLPEHERIRMRDKKIEEALESIKDTENGVGADRFKKLTTEQKAALVDIAYIHGSLVEFENLRKAVKAGDTRKMAEESVFMTSSETGARDMDRLKRNYRSLSGLGEKEADAALEKRVKELDEKWRAERKKNGQKKKAVQTPEAKKIIDDAATPGDDYDEVMLKSPDKWSGSEARKVQAKVLAMRPDDPEREVADKKVRAFYEHHYSTDEVERDEAGRMLDPTPRIAVRRKPVPPRLPDGRDLNTVARGVLGELVRKTGPGGLTSVVRDLQVGLNMPANGDTGRKPLSVDGGFGPKTKTVYRRALAGLGQGKVRERVALGEFRNFANQTRKSGDVTKLAAKTDDIFGSLFHAENSSKSDRPELRTFQSAVNAFSEPGQTLLKTDGWIGSKTQKAFDQVNKRHGSDVFSQKLGDYLGFLD
jgi:hypothetical protein